MGVDPGARATGFCVIEKNRVLEFGHIKTRGTLALRLSEIYREICRVMDEHHPEILVMEAVIYHKNAKTALIMGSARGVVLLAAAQRNLRIEEISPTAVKKAVSGTGRADKDSVIFMVKHLFGLDAPLSEHAADALAVAWCGQTAIGRHG